MLMLNVVVAQLTLQALYPLISNTKILKETIQKGKIWGTVCVFSSQK